ncbi:chromosome transmission fidelity protein 8 [Carpediemonas membranifera]|uniref:Chromosome transmission fidelity protein 8 n=1 Tax=Carpediemonas membranifera TaxID=201153 RepID=A0A8J6B253_9EUKA|nr:chromosome transmission fidelity protein 8 [Carpediemonas membranifera]|eukprot:KAG9391274.1 chromosome transmission fidelity protein 8 [Carpediemonas membranifera]
MYYRVMLAAPCDSMLPAELAQSVHASSPHMRTRQISKPIPIFNRTGTIDEWVLFEFQGHFDVSSEQRQGREIGNLVEEDGKPVLISGFHRLIGKWETLQKPFLVMKRQRDVEAAISADEERLKAMQSQAIVGAVDNSAQHHTSYTISAVVRRRALFTVRPSFNAVGV